MSQDNKWEVKSHSYQIGDTGDYDGWHELTNGVISLGTREDDDGTVAALKHIASTLNFCELKLFDHTADNLAIDRHCDNEAWKLKYDELNAERDALKSQLDKLVGSAEGYIKVSQWGIDEIVKLCDELKGDNEQYIKDFDKLFSEHAALKEKAQKMADCLTAIMLPNNPNPITDSELIHDIIEALSTYNQSNGGEGV